MTNSELHKKLIAKYNSVSLNEFVYTSWELMDYLERNSKFDQNNRELKGEVAETFLQCCLHTLSRYIQPSYILKSLCIPFSNSNGTTELDVTFITPKKVFLFECKAYMGGQKVTKECLIGDKMDVYKQSTLHLTALNQHLSPYYIHSKKEDVKPYKYILFEMSRTPLQDLRDEQWKTRIPIMNANNIISAFSSLYDSYKNQKDLWRVDQMGDILQELNSKSEAYFKKHLNHYKKEGR